MTWGFRRVVHVSCHDSQRNVTKAVGYYFLDDADSFFGLPSRVDCEANLVYKYEYCLCYVFWDPFVIIYYPKLSLVAVKTPRLPTFKPKVHSSGSTVGLNLSRRFESLLLEWSGTDLT